MRQGHTRALKTWARFFVLGLTLSVLGWSAVAALTSGQAAPARVLLVGSFDGIAGQYASIQQAVNAASPGDWILVGPGDYKEHGGSSPATRPDLTAGVLITTAGLHLRGMDRNGVIVDGTTSGPACNSTQADQSFGPPGSAKNGPLGLNGILVYKADNVSVQNLTVCNYLHGSGDTGNEIWWNGGDNTGKVGGWGYNGSYLTATSTYYGDESTAAQYGIFSSNWSGGTWDQTYASNFNDSGYYIGACQQVCDQTVNHAWAEFNALGYSGSNSGGQLVVENSQFDNNEDGFDTNSQNGDNPPPQDGACPNNATSPITGTHSCWVFMDNYVHDNNNPNVPALGSAAAGPVGTGISLSGARNDTVMDNVFANNGAWGTILVPYPDSGPPCTGGTNLPNLCLYDESGDAVIGNTYSNNGFFGNPTNGDIAAVNLEPGATDCFSANTESGGGKLTTSLPLLETLYPKCTGQTVPPDANAAFLDEVACDSQSVSLGPVSGGTLCPPGAKYPRRTQVTMAPLPAASALTTMANPCAGVPDNPWCRHGSPVGSTTGAGAGTTGGSGGSSGSASASFHAAGSVEQVYVTGLTPSEKASLVAPDGKTLSTQGADAQGGLLFRNVNPGTGYRVVDQHGASSAPLVVHDASAAPWDPGIYNQSIPDNGYGYLTTRDGTQLSIYVHPPTSPAGLGGLPSSVKLPNVPGGNFVPPYPTLIEYSGYGYADPAGPDSGIAVLANLMGFAVVDVNMRGTGCSAGAFDFFEQLQNLDGYDVIETIAHQPWVLGHKVGMLGISYGGISQLFTAQTQPPDLEAIAPLSVIDATATTLYPGGILNTGFAVAWAQQRQDEAQPASASGGGQAWADKQIAGGDTTCLSNQALHGEAADLNAKIAANSYYNPAVADPLDPDTFVSKIDVPTFMACQWEDEQTGGHCAQLGSHFTGTSEKWFTFTNGAHIDSLDPETFNRLYDFLELFVAHRAPIVDSALIRAGAPIVYQMAMGTPKNDLITLPADPVQLLPTYSSALAAFEHEPQVTVRFDNGAGMSPTLGTTAGDPYSSFDEGFSSLPVPGTAARTWYIGPGGTLGDGLPLVGGIDQYTSNASALPATDYAANGNTGGGGLWGNASQWQWNWSQSPLGSAVSYVTAPLTADTTVVGGGAVYVWVRSSTSDVDLQATVSEVRPDGKETFVQNGWIRASERKLSTDSSNIFKQASTLLDPIPTFLKSDAAPMPSDGSFVEVAIPLYYEGHVYRAGSRLRVTISAPGGTQPIWAFANTVPAGTSTVSIEYSPTHPSFLVLPVVPGLSAPTPLPPCPSLRNEPCRAYQPMVNHSVAS